MFTPIILFTVSLILLYLTSQTITNQIYHLFYRLTHSQATSLNLIFFLLLPGIFLHEFSHILMAEILRVHTGHLELKPQLKNNQLKLGSAQIAQTDPFRLTLIGLAPFIVGILALWILLKFGLNLNLSHISPVSLTQTSHLPLYILLPTFYCLFAITNTMFSSSSDLQASAVPLILFILILTTLNLTHTPILPIITITISNLLLLLSTIFFLVFLLNLVLSLILKIVLH